MNPNPVSSPDQPWAHYPLHRAVARTVEASDLVALSADELVVASLTRGRRHRIVATRTYHALQQTQAMLTQAAQTITRARSTFAPLGLTRAPF